MLLNPTERDRDREQAVPTRATVLFQFPQGEETGGRKRIRGGGGGGDEEGETGSEDKLTTLATSAVLGRFEWSRAKIVYSERKAGSAIIPASI